MPNEIDLDESNRVQRERYANAPVIANAAAPKSDLGDAFYSQGAGVDYQPNYEPGAASPAAPRMDYGKGFGITTGADQITAAPPLPEGPPRPPVADSALKKRVIEGGVSVPVTQRPGTQSFTSENGYPATDPNLIQDSLSSRQRAQERALSAASDASNVRETTQGMRADAARAQASYDLAGAEQAAKVARFRAANGADVILGSSKASKDRAAKLYGAQADAADAKVAAITGRANAADPATSDPLGSAIAQTDAANRGMAATLAGQAGVVGSAVQKAKLEEQQRVNQLGAAVAGAKTPQERAEATKSLLALLGKDPKKNYTAHPVVFPDRTDPATGAVLRGGSAIAVVSDDGSPPQIIKLDGSEPGKPAGAAPKEGETRYDPVSKKSMKFVNGKWTPV